MKTAIKLESLGLSLRKGIDAAQQLGVAGISIAATGALHPRQISRTGRRDFRRLVHHRELEICAVECPLSQGLRDPDGLDGRIEYIKEAMQLAYDLGPRLISIEVGSIAEDVPGSGLLRDSVAAVANWGDRIGVTVALVTGHDSGEALAAFLASFDSGSLAAAFDPAALYLNGFQPIEDLRHLAGRLALVWARDARRHAASRSRQEVSLGHGELDWLLIADLLREMEYRGYVVAALPPGSSGMTQAAESVGMLRRFIGR